MDNDLCKKPLILGVVENGTLQRLSARRYNFRSGCMAICFSYCLHRYYSNLYVKIILIHGMIAAVSMAAVFYFEHPMLVVLSRLTENIAIHASGVGCRPHKRLLVVSNIN